MKPTQNTQSAEKKWPDHVGTKNLCFVFRDSVSSDQKSDAKS